MIPHLGCYQSYITYFKISLKLPNLSKIHDINIFSFWVKICHLKTYSQTSISMNN